MKPKISIVIPSYNQGRYIEQTITSVLDQQYPNLELIIIDGGSTDETLSVIKKYEQHLHFWESVKDNGQTDAINKGFLHCTGDIFNWLNSDDYYTADALHVVAKAFENPEVKVVAGTEQAFEDSDPAVTYFQPGTVVKDNWFDTLRVGIYTQPCSFMRMKEAQTCFPLCTALRYVMDRELWWKFLLQYGQAGVKKIEDQLTHFRLHTSSKSVAEQPLFDKEFDRLKRGLFTRLSAPDFFFSPLDKESADPGIQWPVQLDHRSGILSAFAAYYGERAYVHDNLELTASFMRFLKKHKPARMNSAEWKMWFLSVALPHTCVHQIKKIRVKA